MFRLASCMRFPVGVVAIGRPSSTSPAASAVISRRSEIPPTGRPVAAAGEIGGAYGDPDRTRDGGGTMEDPLGLRPLKDITVTERIVDPDDVPWVPYTE